MLVISPACKKGAHEPQFFSFVINEVKDIFFSLQLSKIHIKTNLLPKFQENINENSILFRLPFTYLRTVIARNLSKMWASEHVYQSIWCQVSCSNFPINWLQHIFILFIFKNFFYQFEVNLMKVNINLSVSG